MTEGEITMMKKTCRRACLALVICVLVISMSHAALAQGKYVVELMSKSGLLFAAGEYGYWTVDGGSIDYYSAPAARPSQVARVEGVTAIAEEGGSLCCLIGGEVPIVRRYDNGGLVMSERALAPGTDVVKFDTNMAALYML